MSKEFLSQCPEVIYEAERLRAQGKYQKAIELVEPARFYNSTSIELSQPRDYLISDLMRAWRIDVVANTSAAKRSWNGKKVVSHLREAQEVIKTYYNHPFVQQRASEIKKDNEGNPYDFEVEMLRDRARYCLAAASITGDNSFTESAINFFDQAISAAEDYDLVKMEAGIVKNDYVQIAESYFKAQQDPNFLNNLDRARWMSRTLVGEALKLNRLEIFDGFIALSDLIQIRKNPLKIAQDVLVGITRSNNFLSAPINWIRQKTLPEGFNSETLKIT